MGIHYGKADFITYGKPSLFLDFANKKSLTDRISGNNLITFTRTSTGTYVGSDGLIKSAAVDEPRFDHNPATGESLGLLIEEQRTNSQTNSSNFTSGWSNQDISSSVFSTFEFFSSNNVIQITPTGTTNQHSYNFTGTPITSSNATFSVFAKMNGYRYLWIRSDGSNGGAVFDLQNGITSTTVSGTSNITFISNGWYRCSFTGTFSTGLAIRIGVSIDTGFTGYPTTSFTGNGSSILISSPQLEVGAFPTSYIPTTGSAATRTADTASITGTNFSSWYNSTQGTIVCNGRILKINPSTFGQIFWAIGDSATFNESMYLVNDASTNIITYNLFDNGSNQFQAGSSTITDNSFNKTAIGIKLNDSAGSFNGSTPTTDTACTLPTVNSLKIGNASWGDLNPLNGTISQLSYYPTRLTNAQLQNLTR